MISTEHIWAEWRVAVVWEQDDIYEDGFEQELLYASLHPFWWQHEGTVVSSIRRQWQKNRSPLVQKPAQIKEAAVNRSGVARIVPPVVAEITRPSAAAQTAPKAKKLVKVPPSRKGSGELCYLRASQVSNSLSVCY
ncbi:hypothetical protein R1sor_008886 [Riccia sorocarpa]|uniref:Uncharacterized protein n=1 Tax=Riccia sorocarpa TaxID=122646 RepID=A0ABD3H476_9MARC